MAIGGAALLLAAPASASDSARRPAPAAVLAVRQALPASAHRSVVATTARPSPSASRAPTTPAARDAAAVALVRRHWAPHVKLPKNVIAVPLLRQPDDYSCGNNAAMALLRKWLPNRYGKTDVHELYAPMRTTPQHGTEPNHIASYLNGVPGLSAKFAKHATVSDLERAVDRGEPPIVDIQAWQPNPQRAVPWRTDRVDGHYVVLTGYDAENFYFMDPSMDKTYRDGRVVAGYAYIPRSQFEDRWHDELGRTSPKVVQRMAIFVTPSHELKAKARSETPPPKAKMMW